jgi:hypothetical protein
VRRSIGSRGRRLCCRLAICSRPRGGVRRSRLGRATACIVCLRVGCRTHPSAVPTGVSPVVVTSRRSRLMISAAAAVVVGWAAQPAYQMWRTTGEATASLRRRGQPDEVAKAHRRARGATSGGALGGTGQVPATAPSVGPQLPLDGGQVAAGRVRPGAVVPGDPGEDRGPSIADTLNETAPRERPPRARFNETAPREWPSQANFSEITGWTPSPRIWPAAGQRRAAGPSPVRRDTISLKLETSRQERTASPAP